MLPWLMVSLLAKKKVFLSELHFMMMSLTVDHLTKKTSKNVAEVSVLSFYVSTSLLSCHQVIRSKSEIVANLANIPRMQMCCKI